MTVGAVLTASSWIARGGFCPSARFFVCLKQDGQDEQDLQDEASVPSGL